MAEGQAGQHSVTRPVCSHAPAEGLPTPVTCKGPLPTVQRLVLGEACLLPEGFGTLGALEGPLPGADPLMCGQV